VSLNITVTFGVIPSEGQKMFSRKSFLVIWKQSARPKFADFVTAGSKFKLCVTFGCEVMVAVKQTCLRSYTCCFRLATTWKQENHGLPIVQIMLEATEFRMR
jgi:hypothetical protein